MSAIHFDISELFYHAKLKYYGIAKVVCETAYELSRIRPDVKYVVFSPAHRRFFEVTPRIGPESDNHLFDPNMPEASVPIWMRHSFHAPGRLHMAAFHLVRPVIKTINQVRWQSAREHVREVDLEGGALIAMGRPKLMFDYIQDLKRARSSVRFFPLLHDLIPLHDFGPKPRYALPRGFLNDNIGVIEFASGLIANSEFTRRELEDFSSRGILPPLPPVAAVPLVHEHRDMGDGQRVEPPHGPYLLCVGAQTGRKNLEAVLNAMCALDERGRSLPTLALAGAPRKSIQEFLQQPKYGRIAGKVVTVANPGQTDLACLYREALALVIPSRMEGWGLPAGEALWHGTPVISSSAPALKEVCGDLGLYFDPDNSAELARHIDRLMRDTVHRAGLKAKIAARRPALRTWNDFARGTLEAVDAMLAGKPVSSRFPRAAYDIAPKDAPVADSGRGVPSSMLEQEMVEPRRQAG